jgi:hypothetical protein
MIFLRDWLPGIGGQRKSAIHHAGVYSTALVWSLVRLNSRRWLRSIGRTGVLAVGILAICPAFYFSAIQPMQARLVTARSSVVVLNEQLALASNSPKGTKLSTKDQLAMFYQNFPGEGNSSHWLGKLVALAANHGISLDDGEYKATRNKVGRLLRYQMTFPVTGQYPQIRKFLTDLPDELPVVALENVQFERQRVTDPNVEAKIKLVLYMEQEP